MENVNNITEIVLAVITLISALVSAFVIPLVKKKVGAENMAEFLRWVEIGVAAAEQLYSSVDTTKKKEYVLEFLELHRISYDEFEVDAAIEAAVIKLHNQLYGTLEKGGEAV